MINAESPRRDNLASIDPVSEDQSRRVLVAEDEVVAQRVARRYLEEMGYAVVVVDDGATAVDVCAQQRFRLILMDLQLAQMDGLQATQEIRRRERPGETVPILGLTATPAGDERADWQAAGMNGLLIKPLQRARLCRALEQFGLTRPPAPVVSGGEVSSRADQAEPPADLVTLRAKFGDDTEFVDRLCRTFLTSVGQLLNEMDGAARAGERTLLRALAHKIQGAANNVHAHRVATLASEVESSSASMPLSELSQQIAALKQSFDEVTAHVSSELR